MTHERANRAQADDALKAEIEKHATKDEVAIVSEIAREAKGTIARLGWTVILTVVGAVLAVLKPIPRLATPENAGRFRR